jgi:pimeloyl-ACP methyl ester carboxylesterase
VTRSGRWRRGGGRRTRSFGPPGTPVHEGGEGSPLLLLHGVGGTWRAWRPILPGLERLHHVIAPTLLGHDGALPLPAGTAPSLAAVADALEADLDRRGIDRLHVVGNSLGGWLALELARRGRARSVVAFSPAGAWDSEARILALIVTMRASFLLGGRLAARADTIARSPRWRRALLGSQVAYPDRLDPAEIAEELRAITRSPIVRPLIRVLRRHPFRPLPADPDRPVRIVWPERDRVIPFEHFGAPMMARLPGAELVRMTGVGHVPMTDDPVGVTERILEVTRPLEHAVDEGRA